MMHGDASLWESFPRALERRTGTRRYVGAFRAPFQDLHLTPSQEHALRVCSLLAIPPPPPEQKALPGGVPEDLSQDNLSTWADTVQDVAAGMIVPQPGTDQIIFPQVVEILTLLESVSRVAFCRQCYLPGSACRCLESCSTASAASTTGPLWSDIADPTFGTNPAPAGRGAGSALPYGSSATAGGSIWDLPSTDFPGLPGAPSAIRQPRPPAGRASHLESQLMAIRYGLTALPDLLRLPQPTWWGQLSQAELESLQYEVSLNGVRQEIRHVLDSEIARRGPLTPHQRYEAVKKYETYVARNKRLEGQSSSPSTGQQKTAGQTSNYKPRFHKTTAFAAKVEESEAQVDQHQEAQPTEEGNPSEAELSLDDDDGLYIPSYLEEAAPNDPVLQVRLAHAMQALEKETRRCYRCNQQGHLQKDCKEPEEKNGQRPLSSKGPLSAKSAQEKTKLRIPQPGRAAPPTNPSK